MLASLPIDPVERPDTNYIYATLLPFHDWPLPTNVRYEGDQTCSACGLGSRLVVAVARPAALVRVYCLTPDRRG